VSFRLRICIAEIRLSWLGNIARRSRPKTLNEGVRRGLIALSKGEVQNQLGAKQ
jgi:hypothetical protein